MAIIELKNVNKIFEYGDVRVHVLKDVSLSIERGDFACVVGPSGSGKTTLMNIIGCLDRPTSGKYYLDGKDVSTLSDDEISSVRGKYIGFVFQSFYLIPYLSVLENVVLPAFYLDERTRREVFGDESPEDRARDILDRLGLKDRLDFKPDRLSGGQKQRVAIARAIINSPDILIADEPTGQLDRASGREVMSIFEELNSLGKTILVVTHDMEVASHAEKIFKIEDGVLKV